MVRVTSFLSFSMIPQPPPPPLVFLFIHTNLTRYMNMKLILAWPLQGCNLENTLCGYHSLRKDTSEDGGFTVSTMLSKKFQRSDDVAVCRSTQGGAGVYLKSDLLRIWCHSWNSFWALTRSTRRGPPDGKKRRDRKSADTLPSNWNQAGMDTGILENILPPQGEGEISANVIWGKICIGREEKREKCKEKEERLKTKWKYKAKMVHEKYSKF